jgi:competence protein ComEA
MHMSPRERSGYASLGGLLLFAFGYIGARHLRQPAPIVFENSPARSQGVPVKTDPAVPPASSSAPASDSEDVVVHVAGAVKAPGVVHMKSDARVVDAIHAAGGPSPDADLDSIDLAAKLVDGTQLRVPSKGSAPGHKGLESHGSRAQSVAPVGIDKSGYFAPVSVAPEYQARASALPSTDSSASASSPRGGKKVVSAVDVNTAGLEELQALPGVGASTAQKILDYRQIHGAFKSVDELMGVKGIGAKKLEKMRAYVRL